MVLPVEAESTCLAEVKDIALTETIITGRYMKNKTITNAATTATKGIKNLDIRIDILIVPNLPPLPD